MRRDGQWRVRLHNDEVNSAPQVTYALNRVCGKPPEEAVELMLEVHSRRIAEVATFAEREAAEELAVRLQRYGLHASVAR
ncbi:ATP-dependent Clp protease adaptor ClpS [Saccharomonospora marina]|uniref:ATP-dependent Clp protease adaptor ClpS n=1 Tax=Saccharomonospora marina TaxID=632569 RepID=UPI000311A9BE|nr:ATP-dependent Clp protease adaptor ClpS [Saccharomonospora marina]